jgi:hypothetical protein
MLLGAVLANLGSVCAFSTLLFQWWAMLLIRL